MARPDVATPLTVLTKGSLTHTGCLTAQQCVGWHLVPVDLDARPWRRFLIQTLDEHLAARLHPLPTGSPRWAEQLAFRDALGAGPVLVDRYTELKRTLAMENAIDREAYTACQKGQKSTARMSEATFTDS